MANVKILEQKQNVINEIKDRINNAASVVVFDYRGLTVSEVTELRRKLRESGSSFKVYKNTLTKRALNDLNIDLHAHFEGPSAISFSTDALAPVKVLSDNHAGGTDAGGTKPIKNYELRIKSWIN